MSNGKTAAVFGATGLIGSNVVKKLTEAEWSVRVFTRDTLKSKQIFGDTVEHHKWGYDTEDWKSALDGNDAVLNFNGAPLFQKWKGDYRQEVLDSRIKATRQITDAICKATSKPGVFINGSAEGFYGHDSWTDIKLTEDHEAGKDFFGEMVKTWEDAATDAEKCGTRVVNIRTGVVLSADSGALPQLVSVFNRGIGGPIKPGNQWMPWIHIEDEVGIILFALQNDSVTGPVNATSPGIVRMKEFSDELGKALGKPSRIPIPKTLIRLMMGQVSKLLINGIRVVPEKATKMGYQFRYPELVPAMENLLK